MARNVLSQRGAWSFTIFAVLLTMAGLFWPVAASWFPTTTSTSPDPVRITDYRADFSVAADGDLTAVEKLTTEFPYGRHGIFRFWDLVDPSDSHVRLAPKNISVTLDGAIVPFELSWQEGRRFRVAKIGSADRFVDPGLHTYTIRYTVAGAIGPSSAGAGANDSASWTSSGVGSTFYWNLVPQGWQMAIDQARLHVKLPVTPAQVQCAAGTLVSEPCQVTTGDGGAFTVTTGALSPRTPVTVRAAMTLKEPDRVTLPWPVEFDAVFGRWPWLTALLLGVSALGLFVGFGWTRSAKESKPGYPVTYAPPEGLGPVQTFFVAAERVPDKSLVATLLHQAERGLTQLDQRSPGSWVITGKGDAAAWASADAVSQSIGTALGVTTPGMSFSTNGTVSAGKDLQSVIGSIPKVTRAWALSSGLLVRRGTESLGRALVVVAALLAAVLFFLHPFDVTMLGLPFAAFVIGGAGLFAAGVGTRRTQAGREAWARAGGFNRMLSTDSAQDRFDFSAREDLYTAYIPYAVAFDCADEWAKKYRYSTGQDAPIPLWYGGAAGVGHSFDSDLASFESSVRSSISAYQATQSSSSSGGGGGFSGGGGGGGGGGGSW